MRYYSFLIAGVLATLVYGDRVQEAISSGPFLAREGGLVRRSSSTSSAEKENTGFGVMRVARLHVGAAIICSG